MNYTSVLSDIKVRLTLAIFVGGLAKFFSDIIFSLLYRFYPLFQPFGGYLIVIIVTYFLFEIFYRIESKLELKHKWTGKNHKRFWFQFSMQILLTALVVAFVRGIFITLIFTEPVVVMLDEWIMLSGALVLVLLYNIVNYWLVLLSRWRFSLAEIERFKKENAEFRFEMLRNQVNPHFLFNSLNTLSSIMYQNVDTAAEYIRRLSEVYRYVLENRQKELVTIEKEIHFIKAYKYLFELRFTDRISFDINIAQEEMENMIAPMTLQMLIENAVKHNIINEKKPLKIAIVTTDNSIVVSNNFQPKTPEGYSSGMGLKNIKSQYAYFTTRPVEVKQNEQEFRVSIPIIKNKEIKS